MTSHVFLAILTYLPTLSYSIMSHLGGYLGPPLPTLISDVINGCSPMTQFVQRCTDLDVYFALLLLPAKHKAEQNFLFFWCRDRFCQPRYSLFPILCVLESNKKVNFRSSTMGLSSLWRSIIINFYNKIAREGKILRGKFILLAKRYVGELGVIQFFSTWNGWKSAKIWPPTLTKMRLKTTKPCHICWCLLTRQALIHPSPCKGWSIINIVFF